jgi:hypothetical protein
MKLNKHCKLNPVEICFDGKKFYTMESVYGGLDYSVHATLYTETFEEDMKMIFNAICNFGKGAKTSEIRSILGISRLS